MQITQLVQMAKNASVYPTNPLNVVLPAAVTAGNHIVVVVEGTKITDPYAISGMSAAALQGDGVTPVTSAPVVKDNKNVTYTLLTQLVNFDGDLGYWSTLYVYHLKNAAGGNKTFTLTNLDSDGRPVFDNGISMQVYEFGHLANAIAEDSGRAVTTTNPALVRPLVTAAGGDLLLAFCHSRKSSSFAPLTGWTLIDSDRVAGTANDYYGAAIKLAAAKPEAPVVATITKSASTATVLTLTAENEFVAGQTVVLDGLTNVEDDGLVTVATADAHKFTVAVVDHAVVVEGDEAAATATYDGGGLTATGFANSSNAKMAIITLALKPLVIM